LLWVFPGDFRERLRMSALVVAGTIERTSADGVRSVDGVEGAANIARLRIDRVLQGNARGESLRFAWFGLHMATEGTGFAYSRPPVADFRPGKRYLVFLKRSRAGWEVAMPLYAIEEELAPAPPRGSLHDLSQAPVRRLYQEIGRGIGKRRHGPARPAARNHREGRDVLPLCFRLAGRLRRTFLPLVPVVA
jgi:hypothetical protein